MNTQVIGYIGENGARDIRIPIAHLLEKWPGMTPTLCMVPVGASDTDAYLLDADLDGADLVWHVSAADTVSAGTTKATIRLVDASGRIALDEPFQVIISENIHPGGQPPVAVVPWVDKLEALAERASAAATNADAAAGRANEAAGKWDESSAEKLVQRIDSLVGSDPQTVKNSDMLGSKPSSYYLPVVQLLGNAYWKYPEKIINHRGIKSGDVIPTWAYFFDRWKSRSGQLTVTFDDNDGVIANGLDGYFYQITERKYSGESYTAAVAFADGEILVCSGNDQSYAGSPILLATAGNVTGERVHIYRDTAERIETMFYTGNRRVLWLLLTPGTYTAETLPLVVPRPYAVELLACGVADKGTPFFEADALTLEEIKASTDLSGKIPQAEAAKMLAQSISQGRFDSAYNLTQTGVSVPEQWGAVVRLSGENWGTNFISDSYFLCVTSGGDLYTGNQVNGATNITWRRVSVG